MSSMPIATKSALVVSLSITPVEFMMSGIAAAFLTSIRDTCWGDFLARSRVTTAEIPLYSTVLFFNAVLPTCISVWILLDVSRYKNIHSNNLEIDTTLSTIDDQAQSVATIVVETQTQQNTLQLQSTETHTTKTVTEICEGINKTSTSVVGDCEISTTTQPVLIECPMVPVEDVNQKIPPERPPRRPRPCVCPRPDKDSAIYLA